MLKRLILFSSLGLLSLSTFAQKAKVREATRELNAAIEARAKQDSNKEKESLKKAISAIDEATKHEKTKDNSNTWLTKAEIYINLNHNKDLQSHENTYEATKALEKAVALDEKVMRNPGYPQLKFQLGVDYYNIAVQAYQASDYKKAFEQFDEVKNTLKEERKNMFKDLPMVDTVRSQSSLLQGYAAFYAEKNDDAIAIFQEAKNDPIVNQDPNIYYIMAEAYKKKKDMDAMLKTLEEGREKFPEDENLSTLELNYYLESGNVDKMLSKLKEAVKANPNDPELIFNLGIIQADLANNAKDENEKKQYNKDALKSYEKALALDPQNGKFNYQMGAFHFNKAAVINSEMQSLPISEQKKYDALELERNKIFEEAIPFLEDARMSFQRNARNLSHNDKIFYKQSLEALSNIYAILNKMDLVKEIRDEMDSFK